MYSVLTKMRYKKQNWMQGQHNGKMVDLFNWPKFRLTKSVFFRARAVNRGTHVYPRMSKGYLYPLVLPGVELATSGSAVQRFIHWATAGGLDLLLQKLVFNCQARSQGPRIFSRWRPLFRASSKCLRPASIMLATATPHCHLL